LRGFFLTFVTRDHCPLCDEARPVVDRVARLVGARVRLADVEADDELLRRYAFSIPVVLDHEDRVLAEGTVRFGPLLVAALRARLGISPRSR